MTNYDPSKDPSVAGSKTAAPPTTAADVVASIHAAGNKAKAQADAKIQSQASGAAVSAASAGGNGGDPITRLLGVVPATIAAALTPDNELVGKVGVPGSAKTVGSLSLLDQILGPDQLRLGDAFKGAFSTPAEQQAYLNGGGNNPKMKLLEGLGQVGTVAVDPINLISGAGAAADAFEGIENGLRIDATREALGRAAVTSGEDSFAAKALPIVDALHAAQDAASAGVRDGVLAPEAATAAQQAAASSFRDAYGSLNGEALQAGEHILQQSRYPVGPTIHEAPTSARGRAALVTERLNQVYEDVGRVTGENPEVAGARQLQTFGGKAAGDVVRDTFVRGYEGMPVAGREALGITGRLWRGNLNDVIHGTSFNPFAHTASETLAMHEPSAFEGPLAWIRRAGIEETGGFKGAIGGLLQPGLGRSGKLWKAALMSTVDDPAVQKKGLDEFERVIGTSLAKADPEQLAAYPLTALNAARLDGIVRAGGKAISSATSRAQQEVSVILNQDASTNSEKWTVAGLDGVAPTPVWNLQNQRIFDSVDGVTGAKGQIKVNLAKAVGEAMQRADLPDDIEALGRGLPTSTLTMKVAQHVLNDPEFGAAIRSIANSNVARMTEKGLTENDLVRAALNALTTTVSIANETEGVFSWRQALGNATAAKQLFTPMGSSNVGKEAKLLNYFEQMGLATVNRNPEMPLSTPALHASINQMADDTIGKVQNYSDAFDNYMSAKGDLLSGLRARGVTEDRLSKLDAELGAGSISHDELSSALSHATFEADVARGTFTDANDQVKQTSGMLRDVEAAATKLEQVHLALLNYRDLNAEAQSTLGDLDKVSAAVQMGTVNTAPLRQRIDQLTSTDWLTAGLAPEAPAGVYGGSRNYGSKLLDVFRGEDQKATKAGDLFQGFNRYMGLARDVFGDSIELDQLGKHAEATQLLTRGFDQTAGFINHQTIARFFEDKGTPAMQDLVNQRFAGDWVAALNDPQTLEDITRLGTNAQATSRRLSRLLDGTPVETVAKDEGLPVPPVDITQPKPLTSIGVSHEDLAQFTLGTISTAIDAVRPLLDDVINFMETGQGAERIEGIFAGNYGQEALQNFRNGDLTFLNTMIEGMGHSIDTALGISGGFGDADRFAMLRQVVQNDPAIYSAFTSMGRTLDAIDTSSVYLQSLRDLGEAQTYMVENLQAIMHATPDVTRLEQARGPLVDKLINSDLPKLGTDVQLSEDAKVQARAVLDQASAQVRQTQNQLNALERRGVTLDLAHAEALKRLTLQQSMIEHYGRLVEEGSIPNLAAAAEVHQQIEIMQGEPLIATILGGSADFKTMQRGFVEFANDPKVGWYTNTSGQLVRRSDESIMSMWSKRLDGAAAWIDTMRNRAVDGYITSGGKVVDAITQYDQADAAHATWLTDQAEKAFSIPWRGAALADEGAASAMLAIATHTPAVAKTQTQAAFDMLVSMIKAQFVGTAAFSQRKLTSGIIENIRQGVELSTSRQVWAADSMTRELEGFASYAATLDDGEEKTKLLDFVSTLQDRADKHFDPDLFGYTVEARRDAGVTQSVLFKELTGQSAEGESPGFRQSVAQAWNSAALANEARFGEHAFYGNLAKVSAAVAEVPTYPAMWFEQHLASGIERLARLNVWSKLVTDPGEREMLQLLSKASEDFVARPGVEALTRVDLYVQRRLAGDTLERAFDKVMDAHFDYSDLSRADATLRRIFPFWVWHSRSIAHYSEMILHHPAVAETTFGLWSAQNRGDNPSAPLSTQAPGGGYDPHSQLGLDIRDPANDLVQLFQDISKNTRQGGLLSGLLTPATDAVTQDALPLLSAPFEVSSGTTAEGIPIDTPTSIQGPMNVIANSSGTGKSFIEDFAHQKKGKWYWNSPKSAYAFGEALPLLSNVTKITTPLSDGDGLVQKSLGVMTRWFGAPIQVIPNAEADRAKRSAMIERRIARQNARSGG